MDQEDQKGQEDQVMDQEGNKVNKMGYVVEEDLVKIVDQVNHGEQMDHAVYKALVVYVTQNLQSHKT